MSRKMTEAELTALRAEMDNDPLGRGYASMGGFGPGDVAVADSLNNIQDRVVPGEISSRDLLSWAAGGADDGPANKKSRIERIDLAAKRNFPGGNNANTGLCMAATILIQRGDTSLDLSDPDKAAMVAALVATGVLEQSESDELTVIAQKTVSRAQELFGFNVTPSMVANARRLS